MGDGHATPGHDVSESTKSYLGRATYSSSSRRAHLTSRQVEQREKGCGLRVHHHPLPVRRLGVRDDRTCTRGRRHARGRRGTLRWYRNRWATTEWSSWRLPPTWRRRSLHTRRSPRDGRDGLSGQLSKVAPLTRRDVRRVDGRELPLA